jgi:hypothetical protein
MPGDLIEALAAPGKDGKNDLQLVALLFDQSGKVVATADESPDAAGTVLTYSVPFRSHASRDKTPRQYTLLIRDIYGSPLAPSLAPRVGWDLLGSALYHWSLRVLSPSAKLNEFSSARFDVENQFVVTATPSASRAITVSYTLPEGGSAMRASIRIYDIQGRLVRTLLDRAEASGQHSLIWDGLGDEARRLAAGVYFAQLESQSRRSIVKVILTK